MNRRYLVDANLLIAPFESAPPERRSHASALLDHLAHKGGATLPVQALAEFASAGLRKPGIQLTLDEIAQEVARLSATFEVLPLTQHVVAAAIAGVGAHRLSYYDAQIWACAKINGIPAVLSEDFASGSTVDGVRFINPFEPEFDPATL